MSGEGVASVSQSASALPNLAYLRTLVYAPLRDTERAFVEPWFVDAMLNEGYLDLNARLRINKKVATGTTNADGEIDIPTDLVEIENLFFESTPAQFVDDDTFLGFKNAGVSAYGQGDEIATLVRTNVATAKFETYLVSSADYTLEYVADVTPMVADGDAPTKLTRTLIPRIVSYARAHAKWQEGEEQEGAKYMALYEQGLPGAPRDAFRRRPFPSALIPESGPFG